MKTLTPDQERVLTELCGPVSAPAPAAQPSDGSDLLGTWLGLSAADLRAQLASLLARKDGVERKVLDWVDGNRLDAAFEFVAGAALAFYLAEKDANPQVKTYVDAFYYIATCASVGYANIFAATQTGRSVAALVMIVGPGLTSRALERTKN